jgi:putative membrane protein
MVQEKNKLFGASFEQSKRIVKKEILTRDGAQIGISSSMSFWTRASGLIALAFSFIMYGIGIYLPDNMRESTKGVQVISESTGTLIGEIGLYLRPLILALVILLSAIIILDIFPKINYAYQLLYGNIFVVLSAIVMLISSLPFTIGLTIGAFGVLAFVVQLLISVYLFKIFILDEMNQLKKSIYNEKEVESKDWGAAIINFVKRYGGILLGLSILNRWTFNFGEFSKENPGLMSFLSGWMFLLFITLIFFSGRIALKNFIKAFYFFKYRKEYREYFNITNEQWYGKFFARFMSKS